MKKPLSESSTRRRIDAQYAYFLGSWRRSPFDMSIMPQALNVDDKTGHLKLSTFEAAYNNLFRFHFGGENRFILQLENPSPFLANPGTPLFVTPKLRLSPNESEAAVWELIPHAPFRQGPMDVSFQARLVDSGAMLCSIEKTGKVFLQDPAQADMQRDKDGNHTVNIAWEATPDCDEAVPGGNKLIPDWLAEMLAA